MKHINKSIRWATLATVVLLQACTSYVSRGIDDNGKATEVIFPNIAGDAWQKEGTFPNLDNLRQVAPGVTKDQLYDLIGRPHFAEGMVNVREWDYIFNFRTGGGVVVCQYKAIFDRDYKAQTFHWLPAACGNFVAMKPVPVPVAAPAAAARSQRYRLAVDALFAFDKSGLQDLLPAGRAELDKVTAEVGRADVEQVRVWATPTGSVRPTTTSGCRKPVPPPCATTWCALVRPRRARRPTAGAPPNPWCSAARPS